MSFFYCTLLVETLKCILCGKDVYDWLVNSSEMVIYAFLLRFFSPYDQKHVTSKSRTCDQKL